MKEPDESQVGMKTRNITTQAIAKHIYIFIYIFYAVWWHSLENSTKNQPMETTLEQEKNYEELGLIQKLN